MNILVYETGQESRTKFVLAEAFRKHGHQVTVFDWENYLFRSHGKGLLRRIGDRVFASAVVSQINHDLCRSVDTERFDLFFVVRGDHITPETLSHIKQKVGLVANWSSDDVFNPLNSNANILGCLSLYDHFFSPRGHLKEEYLKAGVKSFQTVEWYYRPGLIATPAQLANRVQDVDVNFVGAWSSRRESYLQNIEAGKLQVWGWGWTKHAVNSLQKKAKFHGQLPMVEMMSVFGRSAISVNLLTAENRDTSNFRNYEIPAAGGFQLSERTEKICELFEEDREIVLFSTSEELGEKVAFYLKHPEERKRIAERGYQRLINGDYSLDREVKRILTKFDLAGV